MTAKASSSRTGARPSPRILTSKSAGSTTRARPIPPRRRSNNGLFVLTRFLHANRCPLRLKTLWRGERANCNLFCLGRSRAGSAGVRRGAAGRRRRHTKSAGRSQGVQGFFHPKVSQAEAGGFRQRSLFDERGHAPAMGRERTIPALRVFRRYGQGDVLKA